VAGQDKTAVPGASREPGVLETVLEAMRHTTAYPEVLFRICEGLARAVPCDQATIYVWSRRRRAYLPVADHGTPPEVARDFLRHGYAQGAFPGQDEFAAGHAVTAVAGEAPPELQAVLERAKLHSLVVLPLRLGDGATGALAIGMQGPPALRPDQIVPLEHLAPHVAVLIRNARLEAQAARVAKRRAQIASWAVEVLGASDLEEVTARICEASRALFRMTRSVVMLVEGNELVERAAAGPQVRDVVLRLPLDSRLPPCEVLRTGTVLMVNRFRQTPYAAGLPEGANPPKAVLCAPLVDAGGPLGVFAISDFEHSYPFGDTDEEDARLLAAIATVALRKSLLMAQLMRASAAKSEFLASVSHDLRTPLNVIMGYTQLLAEETFGPVTAEQADALARTLRVASGQLGLINDLLDLARIEQGKFDCHPRAVDVAELVPSLREMMDALLMGRPVRFEVDVPPATTARTDPERLRQVLVNLLTNAAKFTQSGCIRLVAELDGDVRIAVQDSGPGMDPELLARAHEPFVRGEVEGAGTGLGLSIVARLTALLGGRLAIDSRKGEGTTIEVRLPRDV